jgi:hypothetical protein
MRTVAAPLPPARVGGAVSAGCVEALGRPAGAVARARWPLLGRRVCRVRRATVTAARPCRGARASVTTPHLLA